MRLTKILFTLGVLLVVMVPVLVLADQYGVSATADAGGLSKSFAGASSIPEAIGNIISVALSFLGIVFFGLIFYAGILWMTALGESGKVDKAKNLIETAIIGLIIVIGAYAISTFVFDKLVNGEAGSTETPAVDCSVADMDGKDCGDNKICNDGTCLTECEVREQGDCMAPADCDVGSGVSRQVPSLCPGGGENICCVSLLD
ncbi:MAG TPA: pilin [Patescibacteria group bacterium]|nr:pilin [Patescibacteria group bacterium]